ncbi:hypothetical protein SO802_001828 [Lithocarpus litseifolius]|uniref:RNase H type-1 domain-containing protein n=1 Tax=Lithocarpus litseifolius TaxID=425828 RepID=A0AAW2DXD9_9ROSI
MNQGSSTEAIQTNIGCPATSAIYFNEAIFETDSSHLCSILQGSSIAYFSVETICESIILQAESFRFVGFSLVKRKGNKPAHILAQVAKQIGDFNL